MTEFIPEYIPEWLGWFLIALNHITGWPVKIVIEWCSYFLSWQLHYWLWCAVFYIFIRLKERPWDPKKGIEDLLKSTTNCQLLQFWFWKRSNDFLAVSDIKNQKKIPRLNRTTRISGILGNLHCRVNFDSLSFRSVFYTPSRLCFPPKLLLAMRIRSAMRKKWQWYTYTDCRKVTLLEWLIYFM